MPRYKLRTLLILLTVACVLLARVSYVRRMAAFHHGEATRLIERLSTRVQTPPDWIMGWMQDYTKWDTEFEVNPWHNPFDIEQIDCPGIEEWTQAVYHEAMSHAYERALLLPVPRLALVKIDAPKAVAVRSRYKGHLGSGSRLPPGDLP
jgi:hypothetical protein